MDDMELIHFEHITSHTGLQDYYPLVEEACRRISRQQDIVAFAPDVYAALLQGKAELYVGFRDGEAKGFFTCYTVEPPCSPPHLHVWHGYIRPGDPADGIVAAFEEIGRVAQAKGCSQIVFSTRRKGWARAATRLGLILRDYTFFRPV